MKKTVIAAVLGVFVVTGAFAQATDVRIAVFDPQRVSEESEEGKKVQAELTSFRDRKQTELMNKEKELQELQAQLTAQGLSLSSERRTAMEKDIQRKLLELQQARESARNEMQFEVSAAQSRFQEKTQASLRALEESLTALKQIQSRLQSQIEAVQSSTEGIGRDVPQAITRLGEELARAGSKERAEIADIEEKSSPPPAESNDGR